MTFAMRKVLAPLAAACALLCLPPISADQVTLKNGDHFSGDVDSVDGMSQLVWRHPDALDPIVLDPASLIGIDFDGARTIVSTNTRHEIQLTNGDILNGDLVSMDAQTLLLKTTYAGTLAVGRHMLRSIVFRPDSGSASYVGPTSLAQWTLPPNIPEGAWVFRNGSLQTTLAHASIARRISIPERATIDLTCQSVSMPQFRLDFCSDRIDFQGPLSYSLEVSPAGFRVVKNEAENGRKYVGPTPRRQFALGQPVRFRLYLNAPTGELTLFVDHDFIHTWRELAPWKCGGDGFVLKADHAKFEVSNIRVHDWDGRLPDLVPVVLDREHDLVKLGNGDVAAGTLEQILDGAALIKTQFTSVNTPVDRIRRIDFARSRTQRARLYPADVRLYYPLGGHLTMSVDSIGDGHISGISENFGQVEFPLSIFQRALFNIYDDFESTEFEAFLF